MTAVSCDKMPERKPNVIFILMDDAGYGDFGCYGQTRIETPNIDSLAARGIRFTDMYSAAPLSSPARCGLLTGMHTGHAQIRANDEMTARGDVWNHEAMLRDSTLEGQAPLTQTFSRKISNLSQKNVIMGVSACIKLCFTAAEGLIRHSTWAFRGCAQGRVYVHDTLPRIEKPVLRHAVL